MKLTEGQWEIVREFIPKEEFRRRRGGQWQEPRAVLEGAFWILETGAQWKHPPPEFLPYHTVHRCFQRWVRLGVIKSILKALAEDLRDRGGMDIAESFIAGTFVPAKKGEPKSGKPGGARGPRSWQWRTAKVFLSPLGWEVLRRMK